MSTNSSLSSTQDQVLALICAGFTTTAAAAQAGVHRNTVANWLHTSEFCNALFYARTRKKMFYWDEAERLVEKAITNLGCLMDDPAMPPQVRLKATIAMLEHARLFLPPDTSGVVLPEPAGTLPAPEIVETLPKNAQPTTAHKITIQTQPAEFRPSPVVPAPENVETLPKNAQQTTAPKITIQTQPAESRPSPVVCAPKIGRNELCPCGSGMKFKRCCLGKTGSRLENAAAA